MDLVEMGALEESVATKTKPSTRRGFYQMVKETQKIEQH